MKKLKNQTIFCCIITIVFSFALAVIAFFLIASYERQLPNQVLRWLFGFFFTITPTMGILTLITLIRLKVQE